MKMIYDELINHKYPSGSEFQIQRDITRTFPYTDFFKDGPGQPKLERVLNSFAKYLPGVGYVQGMNFIAGSILFHCNEVMTFWLFVTLIEDYDLHEIFKPELPGLFKHCGHLEQFV